MTASEIILATAAREIGYHEGKDKRNKFGEWYGMDGVAWCMEFVQWVYYQAGYPLPYKTASCGELLRWYRKHKLECISDTPVPGCIVIFDFPETGSSTDHTGIFVRLEGSKIVTIDGNTSGGNNSNGGWVQERTRSVLYAHLTYIVPECLREETEGKEDKLMEKRYNNLREISDGAPWATETVAKLIDRGAIRGAGVKDEHGRPADMDLTLNMLRMMVINDRAGAYGA